jgi:hypothetical protein
LESRNQQNFGISPTSSAISEPGNVERIASSSATRFYLTSRNKRNLGIFQRVKSQNLQRVKSRNLSTSEISESSTSEISESFNE